MLSKHLRILTTLLVLIFGLLGGAGVSSAQETQEEDGVVEAQRAVWLAYVLRQRSEDVRIEGMEIKVLELPVFLVPQGESFRPLVKMRVEFRRPDWELFVGGRTPVNEDDNPNVYAVYAYLNSRISEVEIQARGPGGQLEKEKVYIFAPEAREFKVVSPFDAIVASIGVGELVYKQSSFGTFVSNTLTIEARYLSPEKGKRLGYLMDFSMTLYTFRSSPIERNPHYVQGRLGVTYPTQIFSDLQWRSRIFLGVRGSALIPQGSPFGFSDLYGLEAGLRSEYFYRGDRSYALEAYYSPFDPKKLLRDRSIEMRGSWYFNVGEFRRGRLSLGYSHQTFSSGLERVSGQMLSTSFGVSI